MKLTGELWTVGGIPAHPLLVHAVVVLLPLAAVCAVLIAVRPAWRRRYGVPVLLLTIVAVAIVPFAKEAGEQLETNLGAEANPLVARHAELGDSLLPYALVFAALVLCLVVGGYLLSDRRASAAHAAEAPKRTPGRIVVGMLAVLVVLSSAASVVQVVRVGHSGSIAVWEGVVR